MKFNKEFPSLRRKELIWKHRIKVKDYPEKVGDISKEGLEILKEDIIEVNTYSEKDIQKHCMDRERVKKSILNCMEGNFDSEETFPMNKSEYRERLRNLFNKLDLTKDFIKKNKKEVEKEDESRSDKEIPKS